MNRPRLWLVLGLLLLTGWTAGAAGDEQLLIDDFEAGLKPGWESKVFAGETDYQVVACGADNHCLQAVSQGTASGLVYEIELETDAYPLLTWRWKVDGVLAAGDGRRKSGDDYAARVYVIFPHWFFPKTRTLNYIWANQLPAGTVLPNAYTGNAMMIAVQSGNARAGEWVEERRDIVADFQQAFGEKPPAIGAIAIMTDTDNTGASARAWYDDLSLKKR